MPRLVPSPCASSIAAIAPSGGKWWRFKYRFTEKEKRLSLGVYPEVSLKAANSFETIAREWFAKFSENWVDTHSTKIIRRLERDVFPWLGTRSVNPITAVELLTALRRIESRGALETAHRARQNCGQVYR